MELLCGGYRLAALSLIALFCSTTPLDAQTPSREQPRFGGVLKIATIGEPPSLDPHWTTTIATWGPMWHVFETLYTLDKDRSLIPHLAEGHTVTDGGRQYTITLRKGVTFHNGNEMTAADVVASLNRWGRMARVGKALWKSVEAVAAKGPYELVIHLKEPSGVLLSGLAIVGNGAAIYKTALVAKQQLEEVGFKIDLQVLDWATVVQRVSKPELFDVHSTASLGVLVTTRRCTLSSSVATGPAGGASRRRTGSSASWPGRRTRGSGKPSSTAFRSSSTRTWDISSSAIGSG